MPRTADLDQGFDRIEKKQRPLTPNPWFDAEFNKTTAFGREPGFRVDDIPERLGLLHEDSAVSLSGKEFAKRSITTDLIAIGGVTSANITAKSITSDKVAQAAITASLIGEEFKILEILDALPAVGTAGRLVFLTTDGKIYRDNGTAWVELIMPADVYKHIGGTDIPTVDTAAIADAAIETAKLADAAVEEAKIGAGAATEAKIGAGAITVTKIGTDAVETAKIKAGAIETAKIAAGAVEAVKIAAGAIVAEKIGAGAVTTAKLDALAITAEKIAALAIETGKLAANAITAEKIAANTITADEIAAGAVTADIIATNAVIADKIAANAVTALKIAAGVITADHIAAGTITVDELVVNQRMYWYSAPSTTARNSNNTERTTQSASYVKLKETKINEITGKMNVRFAIGTTLGSPKLAYGRIYKNGSPIGTKRSTGAAWEYFEEAINACTVNDLIQIYCKKTGVGETAHVKDFQLRYDRAVSILAGIELASPAVTVLQTVFSVTNQDP